MRDDIVFTTLCITGENLDENRMHFLGKLHYYKVCNILIQSVLNKTNNTLVIVTDQPELFIKHDRIKLINVYDLTDEDLIKAGYMNFHLKRLAIEQGFLMRKKYTIYLDCDVFIENFNIEIFNYLDSISFDVMGNYMRKNELGARREEPSMKLFIEQFKNVLPDKFTEAPLPQEILLIFNNEGCDSKQKSFINFWNKLAIHHNKIHTITYNDSFFIGVSIIYANMNFADMKYHMDITGGSDESKIATFINGFRLIHANLVNSMQNVFIEDFDYESLLTRVSQHAI